MATQTSGMREERRIVTALFADLVGSTPLGERLDPEEVRLIVGEAIARIVRRVEEYGGTGDAVNTAARLQAAADAGAVLVAESARRPVDPLFEWDEEHSLELKG